MEAADQLSVVGDKIQDVGDKTVSTYAETETVVSKVNAYFGEIGEAAEASAEIVKNVYGSGVGQSMDAVAEAVIMVKKNLGDLGDTDLTNLTKQALTLEELYGIDMNETLRGVKSLMKQYGLTAQEAMDYIVRGTQNGLDKTNELGDNLSEYAGKFEQAGYSASEYFQLLQNGLEGGAYNLDKVNDAINEVTTRLADGTIGDSIDLYSQKTQSLFLAWQNGEAAAGAGSSGGKDRGAGQCGTAAFGGHYYGSERGIRHVAGACAEFCGDPWGFAGGVYRIDAGNRGPGGVLRGTEHLPASRDQHYFRSGGGHCRDHRYRQKLGNDYRMVRESVADGIPKADGIMERAGSLFYGDDRTQSCRIPLSSWW